MQWSKQPHHTGSCCKVQTGGTAGRDGTLIVRPVPRQARHTRHWEACFWLHCRILRHGHKEVVHFTADESSPLVALAASAILRTAIYCKEIQAGSLIRTYTRTQTRKCCCKGLPGLWPHRYMAHCTITSKNVSSPRALEIGWGEDRELKDDNYT